MAYDSVLNEPVRPPGPEESDTPHGLQRTEHEHSDVLQTKLQQREHEHQDVLQEKLQRREHEHQHALFDRQEASADRFPAQLALVAIAGAVALNGGAMLLELGHATPAKMAPFALGLVAGFLPTLLAWTGLHKKPSGGARFVRYAVRLLWLASIALFAIGCVLAGA